MTEIKLKDNVIEIKEEDLHGSIHIAETIEQYVDTQKYNFRIYWNGDEKVIFELYLRNCSKFYSIKISDILDDSKKSPVNLCEICCVCEMFHLPPLDIVIDPNWYIFKEELVYCSKELYELREIIQYYIDSKEYSLKEMEYDIPQKKINIKQLDKVLAYRKVLSV